jgi:hypothetical protein
MSDTCKTGKLILFYDDFSGGFAPETSKSPYIYFSAPAGGLFAANDAVGGVTAGCQSLTINSSPFTYTNSTGLDHVKYLVYQKYLYNAPKNGAEIIYEGIVSIQQTGVSKIPKELQAQIIGGIKGVNNVNSDIRLASAGINCLDPDTLMVFDFFLSNEDIYAFYERLPFGRTEWGGPGPNYIGFSHAVPIAKRNTADPGSDFVKLAIAYNYKENYVRWLVNDIEMFRVNRIGYPIERKYRILEHNTIGQISAPASLIRPKQLQYGFGTFSLMDMYNPQNPGQVPNSALVDLTVSGSLPDTDPIVTNINGTTVAPTFLSPYLPGGFRGFPGKGTNFGQGVILKIKYITVYLLAPEKITREFLDLNPCKESILISRCCQNKFNGVNSNTDLIYQKCRGKIDDCDSCEDLSDKCSCSHTHCHNVKTHKCKHYIPHNRKIPCQNSPNKQC